MFFEGLMRALQPQAFALVGIIVAILVTLFRVKALGRALMMEDTTVGEFSSWKRVANQVAGLVIVIVLVGFIFQAATQTFSLRVPRSDVDGSGVYQQMENVAQPRRVQ